MEDLIDCKNHIEQGPVLTKQIELSMVMSFQKSNILL